MAPQNTKEQKKISHKFPERREHITSKDQELEEQESDLTATLGPKWQQSNAFKIVKGINL